MSKYESLDPRDELFEQKLQFAIESTGGSSDYRNDRERPYNGQPHTVHGIRGSQEVKGLTMRDIADCFIKGLLLSSHDCAEEDVFHKVEEGTWRYQDVYKIRLDGIDPLAVEQNMGVEIEKMMGVYPNVKLEGMPSVDDVFNELMGEERSGENA